MFSSNHLRDLMERQPGSTRTRIKTKCLARPLPVPIGSRHGVRGRILVGENDHPFRIRVNAADCLNYWMYVKELVYRIPINASPKAPQSEKLILYAAFKNAEDTYRLGQYFLSADAVYWEECTPGETTVVTIVLAMPKAWIGHKEIFLKFSPITEAAFAGMALV